MLVTPFHEASKFLHNRELKHLLYSQFSTLLGMSFQNTSPEHYCNQGATSRPQHPDDLVSTTLGCAPPLLPHPRPSTRLLSCGLMSPLPNRWDRSRVAMQCPLLCPELVDWTWRADPGAAAQGRCSELARGGGSGAQLQCPQQVLLLTPLPKQEGGYQGGERVWARLWW